MHGFYYTGSIAVYESLVGLEGLHRVLYALIATNLLKLRPFMYNQLRARFSKLLRLRIEKIKAVSATSSRDSECVLDHDDFLQGWGRRTRAHGVCGQGPESARFRKLRTGVQHFGGARLRA